ncbi:uncharacterized protein LOC113315634 [Papaver somniferum]|uniref:uncharacterized protein LOC113315634 n=1 Tax=Papaver somniferum TaxID=3469 RepID=UPI000E6FFC30|nr:uncharacterized protein LOC113315634 [Papaver somniferum]
MSSFKLPEDTIKKMNSIQLRFWWNKTGKKDFFLTCFSGICKTVDDGGLNFRDLWCFNLALLAKAAWRLCTITDSLLVRSLNAKYFKKYHPLHALKKVDSTWSWKSVSSEFDFIKKFSFWLVGNGKQILIWHDKWIHHKEVPHSPAINATNPSSYTYVTGLIDEDTKSWKSLLIYNLFDTTTAQQILSMRIPYNSEDRLCWTLTKNDNFIVKSAYYALYNIKNHNGQATYKRNSNNT